MYSGDDSSALISILIGGVVIVFVAVGITMIADVGLGSWFNGDDSAVRADNDALRHRINGLEIRIEKSKRKQLIAAERREQLKKKLELQKELADARSETRMIEKLILDEQEVIVQMSVAKDNHRLLYRDHVRAKAVGESYDEISTPLGKVYTNVRIREVTPLGVGISHSNGGARLGYRDMPDEWKKKFMFTAQEVASAKLHEQRRLLMRQKKWAKLDLKAHELRRSKSRLREVAELRGEIASVRMKLSLAEMEASLARNKVSSYESFRASRSYARSSYSYRSYNSYTGGYDYSNYRPRYRIRLVGSKSVPGSLETWEQRAIRFERASTVYSVKLANLQSRLLVIEPNEESPQSP